MTVIILSYSAALLWALRRWLVSFLLKNTDNSDTERSSGEGKTRPICIHSRAELLLIEPVKERRFFTLTWRRVETRAFKTSGSVKSPSRRHLSSVELQDLTREMSVNSAIYTWRSRRCRFSQGIAGCSYITYTWRSCRCGFSRGIVGCTSTVHDAGSVICLS